MGGDSTLPLGLAVLAMLRQRVPAHGWDARRVIWAVNDFDGQIDVREVAAKCADWMASGQATRMRDPEGTLRAFFERAKASSATPTPRPSPRSRGIYARPVNGSPVSPRRPGSHT